LQPTAWPGLTEVENRVMTAKPVYLLLALSILTVLAGPLKARAGCPVDMVRVPGGWFQMGNEKGEPDQKPVRRIWVDEFCLDKYEVSNRRFAEFARSRTTGADRKKFRERTLVGDFGLEFKNGSFQAKPGMEDRPVVYVTWREMLDYCGWRGKGAVSEAQWERACRLGARNRPIKVSRLLGHGKANIHRWWRPHPDPVNSGEPDALGLHHMLGNVAEIIDDVYQADWYSRMPEKNPANFSGPVHFRLYRTGRVHAMLRRVARGGAYSLTPKFADCSARSFRNQLQADMNNFTGFRCGCKVGQKK
jgi:sulfatase modifying factor 1